MFFSRKDKEIECDNCNSSISGKFNFCPHCGYSQINEKKEAREFGFLGRDDFPRAEEKNKISSPSSPFGISDKFINSIMNTMIKALDKQMKEGLEPVFEGSADIEQFPNGIKIKIGLPQNQIKQKKEKNSVMKKKITEKQLEKMSNLPRVPAKTSVRRLSDKVVYELSAPGIESIEDVFVSKLENGYEIKAIGGKKVYVNSLPVNLPLKGFSILDNKLLVEFKPEK